MRLKRDFIHDLAEVLTGLDGEPFALVRFADGERAILEGKEVGSADGWSVPPIESKFTRDIWRSLTYSDENYFIGISCVCCDSDSHSWYNNNIATPVERLTFSNLFVNGNFEFFSAYVEENNLIKECAIVGSAPGCDYAVPENAVNNDWNIDGLIGELRKETRPILVAAGPASCNIIYRFWSETQRITPIVDIGSALDLFLHGRLTRGYHGKNSPNRKKICRWK
tara:strand:+ start:5386 stop:6057 length:672 start_codon:yes stop_codon:yes gene_type:complete